MLKFWVRELVLELAITGQQQQSFAVPVQSSCGIYVFHRNVIAECSSRAGKLAQNTVWLVKKNVTIAQAISLHDRMFLAGRKKTGPAFREKQGQQKTILFMVDVPRRYCCH